MSDGHRHESELLMKFGRNVLICQQIECALKEIVRRSNFEGLASELPGLLDKHAGKVNVSTLGLLVGMFRKTLSADEPNDVLDAEDDRPAGWVKHSVRVQGSPEYVARRVEELEWLVSTRNELAHGFLARWCPGDPLGMVETIAFLDGQYDRLVSMRSDFTQHLEFMAMAANFLASPNSDALFADAWWSAMPLLRVLKEQAEQNHRPDGWTELARAAAVARHQEPDDCAQMRNRYGVRTFRKLLVAYPDFEVWDEALSNGRSRTLYRMRREDLSNRKSVGPGDE